MSEMNNQDQDQERRLRDRMNRKPQMPKSPSGFFWVYIILVVGLIGFFVPGMMSELPKVDYGDFTALVRHRDIEKIYRVSNDNNVLQIVLKGDSVTANDSAVQALRNKFKKDGWRGPVPPHSPHLQLSSTWTEDLGERITKTQLDAGYQANELIDIEEQKHTSMSDHLSWMLPIAIMVVLWIFLMRRMGGGGGGQIFNIGKSKAQLFDKDTMVNVTFNDVA